MTKLLRIFVTGANGFVGRALCAEFLRQRFHVIAGVRDVTSARELPCSSVFETGSLAHGRDLTSAFAGCDVVVHAAGWDGRRSHIGSVGGPVGGKIVDPGGDISPEANHVCESVQRANVPHLIHISSIKAVTSETIGSAVKETSEPCPKDAYGAYKLEAERVVAHYSGFARTIVRPPAIYGPGMKGGLFTLFRLASVGVPMPLRSFNNRRDYLAAPTLAGFIAHCALSGGCPNNGLRVLHVRDGETVSTAYLYELMSIACHRNPRLLSIPKQMIDPALRIPFIRAKLGSLVQSLEVDDQETRELMSWTPKDMMREVLGQTATWMMNSKK